MKHKKAGTRSYHNQDKKPCTNKECYLDTSNVYDNAHSKDKMAITYAYNKELPPTTSPLREEQLPLIRDPNKINLRKAQFYYDAGEQLYALGRYKEAGSAYRRAIQLEAGYQIDYDEIVGDLLEKARKYNEKNLEKETYFLYQAISMFAPENARGHLEQGEFYFLHGEYQEAGFSYREAIKHDPDSSRLYEDKCSTLHRRGQEFYRVGRLEDGNQVYHDLLLFNPNQNQLYKQQADEFIEQGNTYFQHRSYRKSLTMFKRAVYVYPGDGNQYVEICHRFYEQEQFNEALELCEYLLSTHQQHEDAIKTRALIIRALENTAP